MDSIECPWALQFRALSQGQVSNFASSGALASREEGQGSLKVSESL